MKTTLGIGMLIGGALLIGGCGKAPVNPPAAPAEQPRAEASPAAAQNPAPTMPAQAQPAPEPAPAPASVEPASKPPAAEVARVAEDKGKPAAEAKTKTEGSETPQPKEKVTDKSGKPSVLGAVGRALLRSFKSDSSQSPPSEAPAFRPQ
jgi:hypothetical protein